MASRLKETSPRLQLTKLWIEIHRSLVDNTDFTAPLSTLSAAHMKRFCLRRKPVSLLSKLALLAVACLPISPLDAQDQLQWPRFRGPNGSGRGTPVNLPEELSPEAATWSISLGGVGHSSPVVWDTSLWVTSFDEEQSRLTLACHDVRDGSPLWKRELRLPSHPMHRLNNPASSTPALSAKGVYLLVYEPGHLKLFAWTHQGEPLWERDLGQWVAQHGFGASPVVFGDKVIVLNSQEPWEGLPEPAKSQLLAFDSETGQPVWSCDLIESKACYATPLVWQDPNGKACLVCATQGDGILVVDPDNGKRVWNQTVFKQRTVGSPILQGNRVIANNGSGGGGNYVVSVDLVSASHPTNWEVRQGAGYVPTVLEVDGRVYLFADNGVVTCVDAENGKEQWKQRVSDGFWASPVADGKYLYCPDKQGILKALKAGSSYELVGSVELGSPSQASPALSDGRLFVRTEDKLWCFGRGNKR